MRFEEEFKTEILRRLKENMDVIESSFSISGMQINKDNLLRIEGVEFHSPVLVEDDPYIFMNKIIYGVCLHQDIKVVCTSIACEVLLELINMVLDEFNKKRVDKI